MFNILTLSRITMVLTTFVSNTGNVHVKDLAYFFFGKAMNAVDNF